MARPQCVLCSEVLLYIITIIITYCIYSIMLTFFPSSARTDLSSSKSHLCPTIAIWMLGEPCSDTLSIQLTTLINEALLVTSYSNNAPCVCVCVCEGGEGDGGGGREALFTLLPLDVPRSYLYKLGSVATNLSCFRFLFQQPWFS